MAEFERLPWAPIEPWRRDLGMAWLSRILGVDRDVLTVWRAHGVPVDKADDIARRLSTTAAVTRTWLWPTSTE